MLTGLYSRSTIPVLPQLRCCLIIHIRLLIFPHFGGVECSLRPLFLIFRDNAHWLSAVYLCNRHVDYSRVVPSL